MRQYIIDQAKSGGQSWRIDDAGNLVVFVAATEEMKEREPVIVQNHLDMVAVKTSDKEHDFHTDPLTLQITDGWLGADRTTLGADNGLGCAAALALMTDSSIAHPPLELLFTVDEETGLGGALNLDATMMSGSRMLNLDTEDWNELYIGCAGGGGWEFEKSYTTNVFDGSREIWRVSLIGLAGGHSGVQIHEQLGNAIKMLGQCLHAFDGAQLISLEAGVAHNVIPREGNLVFACAAGQEFLLADILRDLRAAWLEYLPPVDCGLELSLHRDMAERALSVEDTAEIADLIALFPHGAQSYNLQRPADLVDLSINLAGLRIEEGNLWLESSFRFFNPTQSQPLQQSVEAIARRFGLAITPGGGYPGWDPDFDSALLARGSALHERLFGTAPAIKAIHAGLECGILKSKKPTIDILSFGPTIRGAHSPAERLHIETVPPFWQFLTELLIEM
mgnify:CR=1 FL=1|jgi:dipeptidase D